MRQWWWSVLVVEEMEEVASYSTQVQEGRQVSGTVKEWTLCVCVCVPGCVCMCLMCQ